MQNGWLVSVACGACLVGLGMVAACGGDTDLLTSSAVAADAGGSGPGVSACQALEQCCEESLPPSDQPQCDGVVDANDSATCDEVLAAAHSSGFCIGLGTGVGSGSGTGTSTQSACASLAACCDSPDFPPASEASCDAVVAEGSAANCESAFAQASAAGLCGGSVGTGTGSGSGTGEGCTRLAACCAMVESSEAVACGEIVAEGVDAACSDELTALTDEGFCGVSPPEDACTQLQICCMDGVLVGPALSACLEVAESGAISECVAEEEQLCGS